MEKGVMHGFYAKSSVKLGVLRIILLKEYKVIIVRNNMHTPYGNSGHAFKSSRRTLYSIAV